MRARSARRRCGSARADQRERAEQVGVELAARFGVVHRLDRAGLSIAGVVDQHVDPAHPRGRLGDDVTARAGHADVDDDRMRAPGRRGGEARRRVGLAHRAGHLVAALQRRSSQRPAEPRRDSRDQPAPSAHSLQPSKTSPASFWTIVAASICP
ncbi:MAG: hypothetical protein WDN44_03855 [Sphingomonas sp.]